MTSLYEVLKAQKMGAAIAPDYFTALWAGATGGGEQWETLEYTGAVPVEIYANGEPLIELLISGNMNQSGTPSPTTPIQPQECGERTGNLFDYKSVYASYIDNNGNISTTANNLTSWNYFTEDDIGKTFTVSLYVGSISSSYIRVQGQIDSNYITGNAINAGSTGYTEITVTPTSTSDRWRITYGTGTPDVVLNQVMVAVSATRKEYEPYGYKLPISSGGENLFDISRFAYIGEGVYSIDDTTVTIKGNGSANIYYLTWQEYEAGTYTFTFERDTTLSCFYVIASDYDLNNCRVDDGRLAMLSAAVASRFNKSYAGFKNTAKTSFTIISDVPFYFAIAPAQEVYTISNIMLNLGSTAKPYSPYNRSTTPIYLGEVETERQVKKLVLDGTESWNYTTSGRTYTALTDQRRYVNPICTHYKGVSTAGYAQMNDGEITTTITGQLVIYDALRPTATDIKAYLAQQYANGTPVCVWYVLATPTTGIVNEPLRKIGNYADSLSVSQTIPTVEGENVVDVETTLKPSEIYLKYKGRSNS